MSLADSGAMLMQQRGPSSTGGSNNHNINGGESDGQVVIGAGGGGDEDHHVDEEDVSVTTLCVKPHAFSGAVLSPKHARELTPTLCLAIASALAEQSLHLQQHRGMNSSGTMNTSTSMNSITSAGLGNLGGGGSSHRVASVPYTLWITEAWRVVGWAEPSAALFWEMATMYHTLYLAGRAFAADYQEQQARGTHAIPPILSCGSTSSMGSGTNNSMNDRPLSIDKKKFSSAASAKELPVWLVGTFLLLHCEEFACQRNLSGQDERRFSSSVETSSGVSQLKATTTTSPRMATGGGSHSSSKVDLTSLFKNPSLSPRTRLHAFWSPDNANCTAYVLRHLRKILLLTAVSHNPEAVRACMHLAALPSLPTASSMTEATTDPGGVAVGGGATPGGVGGASHRRTSSLTGHDRTRYSVEEIRRQHDEEHETVGLNVQLSLDDLERLHLMLQPPSGGGIEDPPVRLGEFLWRNIYHSSSHHHHRRHHHHLPGATSPSPPPPAATLALADVEDEIRRHLELDLTTAGSDHEDTHSDDVVTAAKATTAVGKEDDGQASTSATTAMARLNLADGKASGTDKKVDDSGERAKQPNTQYHKELTYNHLRGTTILLKPNPVEASSGVSMNSGEPPNFVGSLASAGRLHDLVISDCSDAHFYLLQPFEHATIAACTGCTIVVGAVAGLLHVVDCEKTVITSAARRILVSNSCDAQLCVFTPSPPLLVGDNRSCQFAPYNTYYDGLREDLLATGLAAAVVPENQSPYHGGSGSIGSGKSVETDAAWPPLQCASNKWKQPVELSKLEVPQVPGSPAAGSSSSPTSSSVTSPTASGSSGSASSGNAVSAPGADDKAMGKSGTGGPDGMMHAPVLVPASEFHVLFVPLESDASRQRRIEAEEHESTTADAGGGSGSGNGATSAMESGYCRHLAEVLQLSPFRLPVEYERHVLTKAERMRNIQQAVQKTLNPEQQRRFEEELNRGFRDWLVTSGNLRQVLDLVHLERRAGV